jgi:hypothetical protein
MEAADGPRTHTDEFSKVLFLVPLRSKSTNALTFENLSKAVGAASYADYYVRHHPEFVDLVDAQLLLGRAPELGRED